MVGRGHVTGESAPIGQVTEHPDITVALLEINDKMNSEMVRYQRYRAKCANRTAKKDPEVRVITSSSVSRSLKQLQHSAARHSPLTRCCSPSPPCPSPAP